MGHATGGRRPSHYWLDSNDGGAGSLLLLSKAFGIGNGGLFTELDDDGRVVLVLAAG